MVLPESGRGAAAPLARTPMSVAKWAGFRVCDPDTFLNFNVRVCAFSSAFGNNFSGVGPISVHQYESSRLQAFAIRPGALTLVICTMSTVTVIVISFHNAA